MRDRAKKRKLAKAAELNREETIQEKLERFERENQERPAKRQKVGETSDSDDDIEFDEFGGGIVSFVENFDDSLTGYGKECSAVDNTNRNKKRKMTKKQEKKEAKNKEKEWEHARLIPEWVDTSNKLPVKNFAGTVLEGIVQFKFGAHS